MTNEIPNYLVTLIVTPEPGDGPIETWDWQRLIDSPYPVTVVSAEQHGLTEERADGPLGTEGMDG